MLLVSGSGRSRNPVSSRAKGAPEAGVFGLHGTLETRYSLGLAWAVPLLTEHQFDRKTTVQKLVLMSVIFAAIFIPARAARIKNAEAGLKKALVQMAIYNLVYVFLLIYVVGRL